MGGGDACVALGGEHIAGDGGEHAGGVVGDDRAAVGPGVQGDPAEFVEGKGVGPADVEGCVQRGTGGDFGDGVGDVLGGDRLEGVVGRRTVSPSVVQDMKAAMNSMNWVAWTIE